MLQKQYNDQTIEDLITQLYTIKHITETDIQVTIIKWHIINQIYAHMKLILHFNFLLCMSLHPCYVNQLVDSEIFSGSSNFNDLVKNVRSILSTLELTLVVSISSCCCGVNCVGEGFIQCVCAYNS